MQHRFPVGPRVRCASGQAWGHGDVIGRGLRPKTGKRSPVSPCGGELGVSSAVDPVVRRWVRPSRGPWRERADLRAAPKIRWSLCRRGQERPSAPQDAQPVRSLLRPQLSNSAAPSPAFALGRVASRPRFASAQRRSPAADDVGHPPRLRTAADSGHGDGANRVRHMRALQGRARRRSNQRAGASAHHGSGRSPLATDQDGRKGGEERSGPTTAGFLVERVPSLFAT